MVAMESHNMPRGFELRKTGKVRTGQIAGKASDSRINLKELQFHSSCLNVRTSTLSKPGTAPNLPFQHLDQRKRRTKEED